MDQIQPNAFLLAGDIKNFLLSERIEHCEKESAEKCQNVHETVVSEFVMIEI